MNIIYLTTHIYERDFDSYFGKGIAMPNPAGQNFHGKMIRSLALKEDIRVYSLPPAVFQINKTRRFPSPEGVAYAYVGSSSNRYIRALCAPSAATKLIVKENRNSPDTVILYDPLNLTLSKIANKVAKKLRCKRVAILTDDIANITGVSDAYQKKIKALTATADGAVSLTDGLLLSYGLSHKPHYVQPFLVEEADVEPKKLKRPYIYYGGALFEKDGTKDLIEAYLDTRPNLDLVISGHGLMEQEVAMAAKSEKRIHFLGQIPKQEHYSYIAGAALCINPRRYRKQLDDNAVPSKVMEYLCFGKCIASTLSTPIKEKYGKDIVWIEDDLKQFLSNHLDENKKLVRMKKNTASAKILSEYGLRKTGANLHRFLTSF